MLTLKKSAVICSAALCAAFMFASFAQDGFSTPPAAVPPIGEKPAVKVPTMAQARQLVQAEEYEEAAKAFHQIVTAEPDNAQAWHMLGYSLHASGNLIDALPCHLMAAEFSETAPIASYNVACVYSLRKKADKAFKWLEKSRDLGFADRERVEGDPDFENIRSDARYAEFLKSLDKAAPGGGVQDAVVDPATGKEP